MPQVLSRTVEEYKFRRREDIVGGGPPLDENLPIETIETERPPVVADSTCACEQNKNMAPSPCAAY